MGYSYSRDICDYCDEQVSNTGDARVALLRSLVRASLREERRVGERVMFDATARGRAEGLCLSDERMVRQAVELARERRAKSYEDARAMLALTSA